MQCTGCRWAAEGKRIIIGGLSPANKLSYQELAKAIDKDVNPNLELCQLLIDFDDNIILIKLRDKK